MQMLKSNADSFSPTLAKLRDQFASMLEAFSRDQGLSDPETLRTLREAAARAYDERTGVSGPLGFERAASLTASRFSLVDDEDMEFSLDLQQLAREIKDATEAILGKIHLRYLILLDLKPEILTEVPVGPEAVCDALRALAESQNLAAHERALLLRSWQHPLTQHLRSYYQSLDRQLDALGISAVAKGKVSNGLPASPVPAQRRFDPQDSYRAPPRRESPEISGRALSERPPASDLSKMIGDVRHLLVDQALKHGETPFSMLSKAQLELLAPELANGVRQTEAVFGQIAKDNNLPQPVRNLLGRLKGPLLDAVVSNESLLRLDDNPVERIVDGLARASDSLPFSDTSHQGYKTLEGIVNQMLSGGTPGLGALNQADTACQAFYARQRHAATELAQAALPFAVKAERRESARLFASRAIQALLKQGQCNAAGNFLIRHWVHVLTHTLYRKGDRHRDWPAQLEISNQISLLNPSDGVIPPDLTSKVLAALQDAGLSDAAISNARNDFNAIAQNPDGVVMPVIASPLAVSVANANRSLVLLHHHGFAMVPDADSAIELPSVGSWIDVTIPNGETLTACVEWIGKSQRAALVTAPDKAMQVILTKRAFGELETTRQLTRRNGAGAFERNLKAALSQLN